jgi:hypothetical protein
MLILQDNQPPLKWNGYLSPLGFQFWGDHHLCHLANIASIDYKVYRAEERPHWELAEIYGSEYVEPGEFLIYRPSGVRDDECPGISALVCAVHVSMKAATPRKDLPIPTRYNLIARLNSMYQTS